MLSFEDHRWKELLGGYRIGFDARPSLLKLEANASDAEAWNELWQNLHHQGDVGEASYAAVPHLVRIYRQRGLIDWNTYAMVATIELARGRGKNPAVPHWLEDDYFKAIRELAETGASEVLHAKTIEDTRTILSILAIAKGARKHAGFLLEHSEEELIDLEMRDGEPAS